MNMMGTQIIGKFRCCEVRRRNSIIARRGYSRVLWRRASVNMVVSSILKKQCGGKRQVGPARRMKDI